MAIAFVNALRLKQRAPVGALVGSGGAPLLADPGDSGRIHAGLALGLAVIVGIAAGNAALLMVLAASASYIAVPAVVRFAIPEAQPSLYFGMPLGVTFPLNILVGIPVCVAVAQAVFGSR